MMRETFDPDEIPTGKQSPNAVSWRLLYAAVDRLPDAEKHRFSVGVDRLSSLSLDRRVLVLALIEALHS